MSEIVIAIPARNAASRVAGRLMVLAGMQPGPSHQRFSEVDQ